MKFFDRFKKQPKNIYDPREGEKKGSVQMFEVGKQRLPPQIDLYNNALEQAQSKFIQTRITLYDFYIQMLMVDYTVVHLLEKRLDNIVNKELRLYSGEKELSQYNEFLQAPQMRNYLKDIVLTRFWGFSAFEYSVADFRGQKWFDYFRYPNKHVNPYKKEILKNQNDKDGHSFAGLDNFMFLGDSDDLGLFSHLCLLSLYKRYGMFDYAKYVDLASENFVKLMVKHYGDDQAMKNIRERLQERKSGTLELPHGVDAEMQNQSSSQQNELFENFMQMLKNDMAIFVLGQTMTTEDGSSRSQAEVHEEQQNEKFAGDEMYVTDHLDYDFMDVLPFWGIKPGNDWQFRLVPKSHNATQKKLSNYKLLKELGYEFTSDELKQTFKEIL